MKKEGGRCQNRMILQENTIAAQRDIKRERTIMFLEENQELEGKVFLEEGWELEGEGGEKEEKKTRDRLE